MEVEFDINSLPDDLRELHDRFGKCLSDAADALLPARGLPERDEAALIPGMKDRILSLALVGMSRELRAAPDDIRRRYFDANPGMLELLTEYGLTDDFIG